jgi:hypothetical protein
MPYHCPEVADRNVACAKDAPSLAVATVQAELARHYDNEATRELIRIAKRARAQTRREEWWLP